ncbi:MAG: cation:proton antiporter [Planctomycetes bacterium]|nr:cation:proton antiporter [Planctomycetota bacterium]
MTLLVTFLVLVFLFGLVSRRLEKTVVTGPILFAVAGALVVLAVPSARGGGAGSGAFLHGAEIALCLLLFTDASRTDLRLLKSIRRLPTRLLSIGLLLSILLGALAAKLLFPALSLAEAGILGAILAPTDAGLGQVIVTSPRVPKRIREALSVEAGLNDGLAVPFFLFFIALARPGTEGASLAGFILEQLGYGVAVGAGIGFAGGKLLALAHRREWVAASAGKLGTVTLPLLAMIASEATGASMFIAAFVAGLAVQVPYRQAGSHAVEFAEEWGQLLSQAVFFLFGTIFLGTCRELTPAMAGYAALSLTAVRMAPVAVALLGTRTSRPTVLFMGWFGPRGLASIVLGLVFLEHEAHLPGERTITLAVVATVFLSILAHGATAMPGIALYGKAVRALPPTAPEREGDVG